MIIIGYVLLYFLAILAEGLGKKQKGYILMIVCLVLTYLAGTRDLSWNDTGAYYICFNVSSS